MNNLIGSFIVFKIIRKLSSSFLDWPAYKLGVIDEAGHILIQPIFRTQEQKDSFTMFDLFICNLKKTLRRIPGGTSSFATFGAALFLLHEDKDITETNLQAFLKEFNSDEELLSKIDSHLYKTLNYQPNEPNFKKHWKAVKAAQKLLDKKKK